MFGGLTRGSTLKSAIFYDFMPKNAVFYANFMKINAILCHFHYKNESSQYFFFGQKLLTLTIEQRNFY